MYEPDAPVDRDTRRKRLKYIEQQKEMREAAERERLARLLAGKPDGIDP